MYTSFILLRLHVIFIMLIHESDDLYAPLHIYYMAHHIICIQCYCLLSTSFLSRPTPLKRNELLDQLWRQVVLFRLRAWNLLQTMENSRTKKN